MITSFRVRQRQQQKINRQDLSEYLIFHHRLPLKDLSTQIQKYHHLQMNHNWLSRASMRKESGKKELKKMSNREPNVLLMIVYAKCRLDKTKMNRNEIHAWLMITYRKKRHDRMKTRISESSVWPRNDYAKKQLVQQKVLRKHTNAFEVSVCDVDSVHWKKRVEQTPIVSNGHELFQLNRKTNVFKISSSKHPCRCWSRPSVLFVISEHSSVRWTNMM